MAIDTGTGLVYNPQFPTRGIDQPSQGFRDNFSIIGDAINALQSASADSNSVINTSMLQLTDGAISIQTTFRGNSFTLPTGNPSIAVSNGMVRHSAGSMQIYKSGTWGTVVVSGADNGVSIPFSAYLLLPVGTTAERPAAPTNGMIRQNSTSGKLEFYNNGWKDTFPAETHVHTIANITGLQAALDLKAPVASPIFTGVVKAPVLEVSGKGSFNNVVIGTGEIYSAGASTVIQTGTTGLEKTWRFDDSGDLIAQSGTFKVGINAVWHAGNFNPSLKQDALGFTPANSNVTISVGNGLSGGGNLSANRTISMGTPSTITLSSANSTSTGTHTHEFNPGGTTEQYIRGDGSLAAMPTIDGGSLTDVVRISETGLGKTGSGTLFTGPADGMWWQNLPTGYTTMTNITTDMGGPFNGYGYFIKLARRDNGGGWMGLYANYNDSQYYMGVARDGNLPTWKQLMLFDDNSVARLSAQNTFTNRQLIVTGGNTAADNNNNNSVELSISSFHPRIEMIDRTTNASNAMMSWNGGTNSGRFSMFFDNGTTNTYLETMFTLYRNTSGVVSGQMGGADIWTSANFNPASKQDALAYTPANVAVSITAGNGLTGGGTIAANRTITLGTPGTLSGSTANAVTTESHTHALSANLKSWDGIAPSAKQDALGFTPANSAVTITAGNGLSGGGTIGTNRTITLGTPGTLSGSTNNAVTATSHTHALSTNLSAWDGVAVSAKLNTASPTFSGQMDGPGGTAAAPAYAFSARLSTGMYSSAANTLNLSTAGVLRFTLTTSLITTTVPITMPSWTVTSDSRLKTSIEPLKVHSDFIDEINVYSYVKNGRKEWGPLAQEMQKSSGEHLVYEADEENDYGFKELSVDDRSVIYALLAEVKSLRKRLSDVGID